MGRVKVGIVERRGLSKAGLIEGGALIMKTKVRKMSGAPMINLGGW